ncbi:isopentenyl diphosphate isomerase/L-lactate dehydrogenase-like FMN-dependent dehydrogenase [Labrenzia sp. EL_13]|nr:isopentenyl diphosphate isomerase/L-lactate dehydrogenase-like FMN-dependent dehydrogenase [Labrenzia sp. EL_13]
MIPASIDDLRELSRRRIPKLVFDYLDGAAGPDWVIRHFSNDLDRAMALLGCLTRDDLRHAEVLAGPVL